MTTLAICNMYQAGLLCQPALEHFLGKISRRVFKHFVDIGSIQFDQLQAKTMVQQSIEAVDIARIIHEAG